MSCSFFSFDSAPLGGIGYCFRVGWHPAGLPPHGIHWQRYCTHYCFFDPAPLGGIGYWLELRSSGLANTSTSAPNVCLSEPSLFGNADLKASAGAPRQSRSHQHPILLTVRSLSDNKKQLPCRNAPAFEAVSLSTSSDSENILLLPYWKVPVFKQLLGQSNPVVSTASCYSVR